MTQTIVLDGIEELPELFASIQEDFEAIDYTDWMGGELDRIADLHKSYFDASSGPDGAAWKANAPSTIAWKGHSTILRGVRSKKPPNVKGTKGRPKVKFTRTRWIGGFRLSTSLTAKTRQTFGDSIREAVATEGGGMMKFGTSVEYSAYNEDRPHVGLNDEYLDAATERAADYTLAALAK